MTLRYCLRAFLVLLATADICVSAQAQAVSQKFGIPSHTTGEVPMHATGTFEVSVKPIEPSEIAKAADVGRMTIDKVWSGDLTGTSKGEMLTGMTSSTGSMAYVAMERVHATLGGRTGTFLFQHTATMLKGDPATGEMNISVVKASGTGDLTGITGTLTITITSGVHRYDFAYSLPSQQ